MFIQSRVLEPLLPVDVPVKDPDDNGRERREDNVEQRHVDVAVNVLSAKSREAVVNKERDSKHKVLEGRERGVQYEPILCTYETWRKIHT